MNQDQINSLIRSALKIVGSLLVAHGLTQYADIVNSPDIIGLVLALAGFIGSHVAHASDTTTPPPGRLASALLVAVAIPALCLVSGCSSTINTPQGKVISITQRFLGLKLDENPTTQTPQGWLGYGSSTFIILPTSTNGPIYVPNYANTFDAANSGFFDTDIGENVAAGNYKTYEPGETNSAPAVEPVVPK